MASGHAVRRSWSTLVCRRWKYSRGRQADGQRRRDRKGSSAGRGIDHQRDEEDGAGHGRSISTGGDPCASLVEPALQTSARSRAAPSWPGRSWALPVEDRGDHGVGGDCR